MKKRKTSAKNKILKIIISAIFFQLIILIGADIISPSISDKLISHYSNITTIEYNTIRSGLNVVTDPIKSIIFNIKAQF